jgi:hypothetical protein
MTFLYSLINWFAISIGNAISIRANWFLYDTVLEVISKQELVLS